MVSAVSLVIKKQKYSIFDSITGWLILSRHLYVDVSYSHLIIISLSIAYKSVEFIRDSEQMITV